MSSGNRIGLIPCLNSDLEGEMSASYTQINLGDVEDAAPGYAAGRPLVP
jgi:hypothetical protein